MTRNPSVLAYDDCRAVFERAIAAPSGVKIRFDTRGKATSFVARMNKYRQLDRRTNAEVYAGTQHQLREGSVYDALVVTKHPDGERWCVTVQKRETLVEVEDI